MQLSQHGSNPINSSSIYINNLWYYYKVINKCLLQYNVQSRGCFMARGPCMAEMTFLRAWPEKENYPCTEMSFNEIHG